MCGFAERGQNVVLQKTTRTGNGHAHTLLVEAAWHHARRRGYGKLSPTIAWETATTGIPALLNLCKTMPAE